MNGDNECDVVNMLALEIFTLFLAKHEISRFILIRQNFV